MIYEYRLDEGDFLEYQLFTVSKSDRMQKKKRNSRLFLTLGALGIAVYFYAIGTVGMAFNFGLIALLTSLFYPKYYKWRYKKHFSSFIRTNYTSRFNELSSIEITSSQIIAKDPSGEGRVQISEVEKVSETKDHFFLLIKSGDSLIIPKKQIANTSDLKADFRRHNILIEDELEWVWS